MRILFSGKIKETRKQMKNISQSILTFRDIQYHYNKFKYRFDGLYNVGERWGDMNKVFSVWPTWEPLPIVFFFRRLKGNCDDAVIFGQWLFRQLNKNNKQERKQFKTRKSIYVQYSPLNLKRTHYVLQVVSKPNRKYKTLSNGRVFDYDRDEYARRSLNDAKYVWIIR